MRIYDHIGNHVLPRARVADVKKAFVDHIDAFHAKEEESFLCQKSIFAKRKKISLNNIYQVKCYLV